MKYKHLFFFFCLVWLLFGCKVKKDFTRLSVVQSGVERLESAIDTLRVETSAKKDMDISKIKIENIYRKTTDFDADGRIRQIIEEWINNDSKMLASQKSEATQNYINGIKTMTYTHDTLSANESVMDKSTADSRPIQGADWFWVVLGGALVLAVILFVIYKKSKI